MGQQQDPEAVPALAARGSWASRGTAGLAVLGALVPLAPVGHLPILDLCGIFPSSCFLLPLICTPPFPLPKQILITYQRAPLVCFQLCWELRSLSARLPAMPAVMMRPHYRPVPRGLKESTRLHWAPSDIQINHFPDKRSMQNPCLDTMQEPQAAPAPCGSAEP